MEKLTDEEQKQVVLGARTNRQFVSFRDIKPSIRAKRRTFQDADTPPADWEPTASDGIDDTFLADILNEHNLVVIGNYVYRLDFGNEVTFVLHESYVSEPYVYDEFLNATNQTDKVFAIAFQEPAIDRLEESNFPQQPTTLVALCGEGGTGGETRYRVFYSEREVLKYQIKLQYQKFGVFFRLRGNIDGWEKQGNGWTRAHFVQEVRFNYLHKFKPRCWSERNEAYATINVFQPGNPAWNMGFEGVPNYRNLEMNPWSSTRPLNRYWLRINLSSKAVARLNYAATNTEFFEIKKGY